MPRTVPRDRAEDFRRVATRVVAHLPGRLAAVTPPSLVGFAVVGAFTFSIDLLVLTVLRTGLGLPLGLAVSLGYVVAFAVNFVLNRWLTFDARRRVGRQLVRHVLVVAVNYVGIVLGLTVGLAGAGVPYPVARVAAGMLEVAFLYCAQRWVVFARDRGRDA